MPRSAKISSTSAQAEAEHVGQPDSMADDLGWEPMTIVAVGWRLHAISLARRPADCQVRLPRQCEIGTSGQQQSLHGSFPRGRSGRGARRRICAGRHL